MGEIKNLLKNKGQL